MLETMEKAKIPASMESVRTHVFSACLKIPPLWDLRNYVAVNPFLGFTSHSLVEAARVIGEGLGAKVLPDLSFYRSRWNAGDFTRQDLESSANRAGINAVELEAILSGRLDPPARKSEPSLTFAERHDRRFGSDWNDFVIRAAARHCAVHASAGGSYWKTPGGEDLFGTWREAASVDRTVDIAGLSGFRAFASRSPERPDEAIAEMLDLLEVGKRMRGAYLYRLLGGLYGWASYFRRLAWERDPNDPGQVVDLLAIRICSDAGVHLLARRPARGKPIVIAPVEAEDESFRLSLQEAFEDGYARRLLGAFNDPHCGSSSPSRPAVQAVFCIDVRSEPLRRHLEAESARIETRGFAGFFGVPLSRVAETGESPRCPVLLKPRFRVEADETVREGIFAPAIRHMQSAPAASFSFVEVLGLGYGLKILRDAANPETAPGPGESADPFSLDPVGDYGIDPSARLDLAAGILKNMGFRDTFARLVMLCGHEGHSANNPHAAGLDCGACGGHGGAINARVAAAALNDPGVRNGLPGRGWHVPQDTYFLPAVHDTSTDDVRLLDLDRVPSCHVSDVRQLELWLKNAGAATRRGRARSLGLADENPSLLERILRRRAGDWSEVRPEWALARNAAFIAARRSRTRGVDLEGRTFLHEYDSSGDPDDSILTLILTAPMVVASWINLQYFASTVDNGIFGSGNKALHNRVGALGVVLGNGGDLRTGLPLQSVHADDGSWFHAPLRLQVVVEAPREKIDRVLLAQTGVRELVENGWIRLFALAPDSLETDRYVPGRGWETVDVNARQCRRGSIHD